MKSNGEKNKSLSTEILAILIVFIVVRAFLLVYVLLSWVLNLGIDDKVVSTKIKLSLINKGTTPPSLIRLFVYKLNIF